MGAEFDGEAADFELARLQGEWKHAERMKAIEMGFAPSPPHWPAAIAAAAIGAGVPIGLGICLTLASAQFTFNQAGWNNLGAVGSAAILAALVIAWRGFAPQKSVARASGPAGEAGKPRIADPDAYDVVGRRG